MNESSSDGASTSVARPSIHRSSNSSEQRDRFVIATCRRNKDVTINSISNANQETTEESDNEERLLVVYCRAGRLGAAYYTLQTGELFILDVIVDRPPSYQMFLNLFAQVDPVRVVLDGKQGAFVAAVKKAVFSEGADDDEARCRLVFLSNKEYGYEACKRRIHSLSLPHEPPNCTEEERIIFLRTVVDFSQTQSIHALGALLRYLDLNWTNINMDLQSKPQFFALKKISLISHHPYYLRIVNISSALRAAGYSHCIRPHLCIGSPFHHIQEDTDERADIVTIDEDTYRGLQIFSSVSHPSNFKKGVQGSNKEGLSLYHVFSKCSSKVGQSRMRVLLRHPTNDLATLQRRQDVVAYFLRPQSDSIMRNICSSLRFIKSVNGILAKIKALSAKPYQWKSLYNTLYNAVLICEMCENARNAGEFLEQLASCDNNKLYEMALYMNRIIDFDLSKTEGKFTVKAGVDPELDMKKQTMASLHGLMSETAKVELDRLPLFIEECTMLYMPHLGYLLGVKAWADNLTPGQKELPDMKFMFQNNDYIHYKSKGCEELDVMIGDTYPEIVAHETRIMMRLTAHILQHLHTLAAVIDKCAELDCLIAISKVSKEYNFVRPTLTTDKIIDIKQGKHPLHMITCDNFVPNDTESSQEAGFVKILTGPNSSGKSVYLKQIGLIVYLAHVGSFVPAQSARVGAVSHIHSRIQSTECVAAHMSAFLIDLRQMSLALESSGAGAGAGAGAGGSGLVLVDEFGKGSSPADGLALLAAATNTLLLRDHCPHLFLATHFLNIREFIVDSPLVSFMRFEHIVEDDEPVFLFRLTEGVVDSSFAHQVAATSIDGYIIRRAKDVMTCMMNNSLPPENKKIAAKLKSFTETMKNELLTEDI